MKGANTETGILKYREVTSAGREEFAAVLVRVIEIATQLCVCTFTIRSSNEQSENRSPRSEGQGPDCLP